MGGRYHWWGWSRDRKGSVLEVMGPNSRSRGLIGKRKTLSYSGDQGESFGGKHNGICEAVVGSVWCYAVLGKCDTT